MKNKQIFVSMAFLLLWAIPIVAQEAPLPDDDSLETIHEMRETRERRERAATAPRLAREELTEEQIQETLVYLEAQDPPVAEFLKQLQTEKPHQFRREISKNYYALQRMKMMKERGVEQEEYERMLKRYKMETQVRMLAEKYKRADERQKGKYKTELRAVLDKLFDLREVDRMKEVERLEGRLEELQQSLKNRKENKEKIIDRRIDQLIGNDDLEW